MVGAVTNMQFTYSFPSGFTFLYLLQLHAAEGDGEYVPGSGAKGRIDTWSDWSRWKQVSTLLRRWSRDSGLFLSFPLLCFALLCFALFCFALLYFALLYFALLCFSLPCFALPRLILAYPLSSPTLPSQHTSDSPTRRPY